MGASISVGRVFDCIESEPREAQFSNGFSGPQIPENESCASVGAKEGQVVTHEGAPAIVSIPKLLGKPNCTSAVTTQSDATPSSGDCDAGDSCRDESERSGKSNVSKGDQVISANEGRVGASDDHNSIDGGVTRSLGCNPATKNCEANQSEFLVSSEEFCEKFPIVLDPGASVPTNSLNEHVSAGDSFVTNGGSSRKSNGLSDCENDVDADHAAVNELLKDRYKLAAMLFEEGRAAEGVELLYSAVAAARERRQLVDPHGSRDSDHDPSHGPSHERSEGQSEEQSEVQNLYLEKLLTKFLSKLLDQHALEEEKAMSDGREGCSCRTFAVCTTIETTGTTEPTALAEQWHTVTATLAAKETIRGEEREKELHMIQSSCFDSAGCVGSAAVSIIGVTQTAEIETIDPIEAADDVPLFSVAEMCDLFQFNTTPHAVTPVQSLELENLGWQNLCLVLPPKYSSTEAAAAAREDESSVSPLTESTGDFQLAEEDEEAEELDKGEGEDKDDKQDKEVHSRVNTEIPNPPQPSQDNRIFQSGDSIQSAVDVADGELSATLSAEVRPSGTAAESTSSCNKVHESAAGFPAPVARPPGDVVLESASAVATTEARRLVPVRGLFGSSGGLRLMPCWGSPTNTYPNNYTASSSSSPLSLSQLKPHYGMVHGAAMGLCMGLGSGLRQGEGGQESRPPMRMAAAESCSVPPTLSPQKCSRRDLDRIRNIDDGSGSNSHSHSDFASGNDETHSNEDDEKKESAIVSTSDSYQQSDGKFEKMTGCESDKCNAPRLVNVTHTSSNDDTGDDCSNGISSGGDGSDDGSDDSSCGGSSSDGRSPISTDSFSIDGPKTALTYNIDDIFD